MCHMMILLGLWYDILLNCFIRVTLAYYGLSSKMALSLYYFSDATDGFVYCQHMSVYL